jgi:hypothetical protein
MLFGLSRLYTALIGGAVGLAIILGAILWHNHAVTAAYNRGKADEAEHVAAQAIALKSQVDTLSTNISTLIRSRTDAENDRISDVADALRLRGPGKATCPRPAGVPAGAGGRDRQLDPQELPWIECLIQNGSSSSLCRSLQPSTSPKGTTSARSN